MTSGWREETISKQGLSVCVTPSIFSKHESVSVELKPATDAPVKGAPPPKKGIHNHMDLEDLTTILDITK